MMKMTSIRNLLLAGVAMFGSVALADDAVAWFNGGLDASWPAHATGGSWSCSQLSTLKWTESDIPGVATKVPGVTLANWAHVGLAMTAASPVSLGSASDATDVHLTTKVLLTPVLKENMPGVSGGEKAGLLPVLEDDGSVQCYVLAQADEANGTGGNVWKRAVSLPRIQDDTVPVTIGISFRRDGAHWLVDYSVDGASEPSHVIAVGSSPTLSQVSYIGPCTVQSLSATLGEGSVTPPGPTDPTDPTDPPGPTDPDDPDNPDNSDNPPETPEVTQMFYIGETGYDSWEGAYNAAKNGDTITVGKNAVFAVSGTAKSITIDLCGRDLEWTASGWGWDGLTVTDSVGSGQLTLSGYSRNVGGIKLDLSSLNKDQLNGGGIFWSNASTEIKFPKGMTLAECTARVGNASNGTRIVVQGVTYTYADGSWVGSGKVYPEWIDATSSAETGKYDSWSEAKGVTDPAAALEEAYLLNCANTAAAVETAKAAFQITSISVGANEAVVLGLPEGDFNGTITVLGCETVNGTYHVKKVGDHFFKAILGK